MSFANTPEYATDGGILMPLSDLPLGDSRAEDLFDAAVAESNPRCAIGILHRVLSYGRADLQAFKAYADLGACYWRLGNLSRALHYYDLALALGEDDPYTRCYRGMIHYARGDHAAALVDLEVAAATGTDYLHQNRDVWEPAAQCLYELRQRLR